MADNAHTPAVDTGRRSALGLAALLLGSGVLHFLVPQPYDSIVPRALPGRARDYTYASGVAELGITVALAVPCTRNLGGRLAALLFVSVFPANVQFTVDMLASRSPSPIVKGGSVLRLPLITRSLKASRRARRI